MPLSIKQNITARVHAPRDGRRTIAYPRFDMAASVRTSPGTFPGAISCACGLGSEEPGGEHSGRSESGLG